MYLIYMYEKDLELNNLQWLTCHKAKPTDFMYIDQKFLFVGLRLILAFLNEGVFKSLTTDITDLIWHVSD